MSVNISYKFVLLVLQFFFLSTLLHGKESVIKIEIKSNKKNKIREIVWFDERNIRGKVISGVVENSKIQSIESDDSFGILRIVYDNLHYYEYLIRSGDTLRLCQDENKLELTGGVNYKKYDLCIDSLFQQNLYTKQDPIKLYLHPGDYLDWTKSTAKNEEKRIKKKAYNETLSYIPKAIQLVDSLKYQGLLSANSASFYHNKLTLQRLNIALLEGEISMDSIKIIFKEYMPNTERYPYRYLYKFGELITNEAYVKNAKKINLNDGVNRDVTEIYDKIENSDVLPEILKIQLCLYYLKRIVYAFPKEIGIRYYESFINSTNNSLLLEEAKLDNYDRLFVKGFKSIVQTIDSKSIIFTDLFSKQYYTYIDFWASWCGPCIAEMSHSKLLKDKYRDNINFVYVSLDTKENKWKQSATSLRLTLSENFWIPSAFESDVAKLYGITSIPRYMIVDKTGKVIDSNAPRPSDPKINELFDKLINN